MKPKTPANTPVPPRLVDIETVSQMLDRCPRSIHDDAREGLMPAPIRLGRSVRWRLAEIEAWIDAGCPAVKSSTDQGA